MSLDGLKETHDRLRSGSFDRVLSNIKSANHSRIYIHFTLNRENWREVEPLTEWIAQIPLIKGLTVQFFYPYHQGEEDLALLSSQRRAAVETLIRLKDSGVPILNSAQRLKAMIQNIWRCHDDILINVDPDGTITQGCYVKRRGQVRCDACGFTPVAEASGALDLMPQSLYAEIGRAHV